MDTSISSTDSSNALPIWCHICNGNRFGALDEISQELQCVSCSSTFVERIGQGVETFLNQNRGNQPNRADVRSPAGVGLLISSQLSNRGVGNQQAAGIGNIVDRIMNFNRLPSPMENSFLNTATRMAAVENTGDPFDIIIRPMAPSSMSPASGMISTREPMSATEPVQSATQRLSPPTRRRSVTDLLDALLGIQRSGHEGSETTNLQLEEILHHILMHEQSRAGVPPASLSTINGLPRLVVDNETIAQCPSECNISLEPFVIGDICVSLPCGHKYKEGEIVKWLEMHATCPVCRISIQASN